MIGIFILLILAMFLVVKFCKKTLKIILSCSIIFITIYCVILAIDMNRVYSLKKPIFAVSSELKDYEDYSKASYRGLGYRIEIDTVQNQQIISSTMYMFHKVIAAATT